MAGPEQAEDGQGARQVLRVEEVCRCSCPSCHGRSCGGGEAGPSGTRQGSAKLHFCLGCEDVKMAPLAQAMPWEPPVRSDPRLMWKPDKSPSPTKKKTGTVKGDFLEERRAHALDLKKREGKS